MSTQSKGRLRRTTRIAIVAVVTGILSVAGTVSANAFFFNEGDLDHFLECFGLMLLDPAAHREECSPYIGPGPDGSSLTGPVDGTPPIVIVTTTTTPTTTTVVPTTTEVPTTTYEPDTTTDWCDPPADEAEAIDCPT
jgi:hypothetical protein